MVLIVSHLFPFQHGILPHSVCWTLSSPLDVQNAYLHPFPSKPGKYTSNLLCFLFFLFLPLSAALFCGAFPALWGFSMYQYIHESTEKLVIPSRTTLCGAFYLWASCLTVLGKRRVLREKQNSAIEIWHSMQLLLHETWKDLEAGKMCEDNW